MKIALAATRWFKYAKPFLMVQVLRNEPGLKIKAVFNCEHCKAGIEAGWGNG